MKKGGRRTENGVKDNKGGEAIKRGKWRKWNAGASREKRGAYGIAPPPPLSQSM